MSAIKDADANPGPLPADTVIQPIIHDATTDYAAICVLNNEKLFITKDDTIIAPMRGNMPFGRKIKPGLVPACYFDLVFPGGRTCAHEIAVNDPSGVTLYGYDVYAGADYLGRCAGCTPDECN
jgi:hypothetical protein